MKYTWICIAHLHANASNILRYGSHSVTCKQHHICLYSQSQNITALWPVLIAPTTEGWTGWVDLVGWLDWDRFPARGVEPETVTHPSTNQARCRVNSLIWPTSLPTAPISLLTNKNTSNVLLHCCHSALCDQFKATSWWTQLMSLRVSI